MLNLEPLRTGAAMVWDGLDERERMVALYALAWLVFAGVAALQRRSRDSLRREIVEELAAHAGRSDD